MSIEEFWEMCWDNPQIEIEHDIMEAEIREYEEPEYSKKLNNKILLMSYPDL